MGDSDIRLIALDLDGTLLNKDRQIQEQDAKIIQKVMAKGVIVTLASARPLCSMLPYARQLRIKAPLISLSGAYVSDMQETQIILKQPLDLTKFQEMIAVFEEQDYYIKVYSSNRLFVQEDDEVTRSFSQKFNVPYTAMGKKQLKTLTRPPFRLAMFSEPSRIEKARKILEDWPQHFTVMRDTDRGLDIVERTVSKGAALTYLCRQMNIPLKQVMAIGNEGSDLAMIQAAGLGVAMGNACAELKEQADFVTKENTQCGVGFAIQQHILKN